MYPPELAELAAAAAAAGNGIATSTSSGSNSSGGDGTNSSSSEGPAAQPPCPPVDKLPKVRAGCCSAALIAPGMCWQGRLLCLLPLFVPTLLASLAPLHCPPAPLPFVRSLKCFTQCEPGWKRSTAPACPASDVQPYKTGQQQPASRRQQTPCMSAHWCCLLCNSGAVVLSLQQAPQLLATP
jgi:hypothetical protein